VAAAWAAWATWISNPRASGQQNGAVLRGRPFLLSGEPGDKSFFASFFSKKEESCFSEEKEVKRCSRSGSFTLGLADQVESSLILRKSRKRLLSSSSCNLHDHLRAERKLHQE
jgi:hypothetical protein